MSFVWPLYPFTATSPTWATTTGLNALATVHPRPSRTRLTNSPASSITSLPLVSLMTKPSLPSLKLATRNADSVNCNPSHGKWVTQSWRQPCDLQFLERGVQTLSCQFIHTFPVCAFPRRGIHSPLPFIFISHSNVSNKMEEMIHPMRLTG